MQTLRVNGPLNTQYIVYKNCALNPHDIKYIPTLSYCNNSVLYNQPKLTLK